MLTWLISLAIGSRPCSLAITHALGASLSSVSTIVG
jgi:hypothetical protein